MSESPKSYISISIGEDELSVVEIPTPVAEKAMDPFHWVDRSEDAVTVHLQGGVLIHIHTDT